eukprot:4852102-Ditylum_brightwellii.AAC.1
MFEGGLKKKFNRIIMNNCMDIVLKWHQFVKGIVDYKDLLLNISLEMLQQNKFCCVIKKNLVMIYMDPSRIKSFQRWKTQMRVGNELIMTVTEKIIMIVTSVFA